MPLLSSFGRRNNIAVPRKSECRAIFIAVGIGHHFRTGTWLKSYRKTAMTDRVRNTVHNHTAALVFSVGTGLDHDLVRCGLAGIHQHKFGFLSVDAGYKRRNILGDTRADTLWIDIAKPGVLVVDHAV